MPKQKDRAEEFQALLVTQGAATRSLKYADWEPTDEEREQIRDRAARLVELAELLGHEDAERYVNDHIARWLQLNPLALTKRRVKRLIDESADNVDGQVSIQIGEPTKGGYFYQVLADDCGLRNGILHFAVPESVAEHFRQQGRRDLQAELRHLLNVARA